MDPIRTSCRVSSSAPRPPATVSVSTSTVCREVSFWGPSGRAVLLEKSEEAAAAHAYMVVRMLPPHLPLKRWHEVLDGPGSRGFRFVPGYSTFTCRNFPLWEGGPTGMVWVLDKSPDARRFEYRIGAPGSAKALYEEIDAGEKTGFEIAAMLPLDGMLILVMERELDKAAAPLAGMTDGRLIVLEKVSTSAGR